MGGGPSTRWSGSLPMTWPDFAPVRGVSRPAAEGHRGVGAHERTRLGRRRADPIVRPGRFRVLRGDGARGPWAGACRRRHALEVVRDPSSPWVITESSIENGTDRQISVALSPTVLRRSGADWIALPCDDPEYAAGRVCEAIKVGPRVTPWDRSTTWWTCGHGRRNRRCPVCTRSSFPCGRAASTWSRRLRRSASSTSSPSAGSRPALRYGGPEATGSRRGGHWPLRAGRVTPPAVTHAWTWYGTTRTASTGPSEAQSRPRVVGEPYRRSPARSAPPPGVAEGRARAGRGTAGRGTAGRGTAPVTRPERRNVPRGARGPPGSDGRVRPPGRTAPRGWPARTRRPAATAAPRP